MAQLAIFATNPEKEGRSREVGVDKLDQASGTDNASIQVGPEDVLYYRHPKYSMITFTQNYQSKLARGGGWGHRSRGTKILYVAEEAGQPKIIAETYSSLIW